MTPVFVLLVGLALAFAGSAAAAALVTTARATLAEAIARRLRGSDDSLDWVAVTERQIVAAGAATSLGLVVTGAAIPGLFRDLSLWHLSLIILAVAAPAALLGGYLLPRWLTAPRAERVVAWAGPALSAWGRLMGSVLPSRLADPTDDVRTIAREGAAKGLGGDQLVMVGGVMTFSERPVRAVMTPRTEVMAVEQETAWEEVMRVFTESGYTRLPVYRHSLDEIVGMVHAFDLFKVGPDDALPIRPVTFAPESRQAGDLLLDMQRDRRHFAVVLDEFGGTAGIVTFEDLLEGLVGEISDEDDVGDRPLAAAANLMEFEGSTPPALVAERCGVDLPGGEAVSIGGLIAELLGRIPLAGERFALRGLDIDILSATPTRVERLLIRRGRTPVIPLDRDPR